MTRAPVFRLFLMLALLLNGLVAAHAAVGHALMQMPAAEKGCHDMPAHEQASSGLSSGHHSGHSTEPHAGSSCCQGPVCNCACALQLPVSPLALNVPASWQPLRLAQPAERWLSLPPSLILRPPIA
jgi:hypothetical protein